jgi:hypothetical protein
MTDGHNNAFIFIEQPSKNINVFKRESLQKFIGTDTSQFNHFKDNVREIAIIPSGYLFDLLLAFAGKCIVQIIQDYFFPVFDNIKKNKSQEI